MGVYKEAKENARKVYAQYKALVDAGFTESQAWELLIAVAKKN